MFLIIFLSLQKCQRASAHLSQNSLYLCFSKSTMQANMKYLQSIVLHVNEIGYSMKNVGICLGCRREELGLRLTKERKIISAGYYILTKDYEYNLFFPFGLRCIDESLTIRGDCAKLRRLMPNKVNMKYHFQPTALQYHDLYPS